MWSGKRALEVGLVDALGGLSRAVAIAKQQLKIPDCENVALVELSREQMSPLMLLSGGASATFATDILKVLFLPQTHGAGSACKEHLLDGMWVCLASAGRASHSPDTGYVSQTRAQL